MGIYGERIVPRLVNVTCGTRTLSRWRTRVCEGLSGEIVEIGFGSGHNVGFYPSAVHTVAAVEPSPVAMRLARARIDASPAKVVHVGSDGASLALEDERCDAALCTFTLCTVADPNQVLSEIRRVLRPGGVLHFLEHGVAPLPDVERWQWRLDPLQQCLGGGCHLTRDPVTMIEQARFDVDVIDQRFATGPRPWTYFTLGRATKAM